MQMDFSRKLCAEYIKNTVIIPYYVRGDSYREGIELNYHCDKPLGSSFCDFISLDFSHIIKFIEKEMGELLYDDKGKKLTKAQMRKLRNAGKIESVFQKIVDELGRVL